jgi:hypothetical protein
MFPAAPLCRAIIARPIDDQDVLMERCAGVDPTVTARALWLLAS